METLSAMLSEAERGSLDGDLDEDWAGWCEGDTEWAVEYADGAGEDWARWYLVGEKAS